MADVTVNRFDEFESYSGQFLDGGKGVGVTAWGMNVLRLPATCAGYTEHDHRADGQEKVYVVLRGSVTLQADGETGSSSRVRWPASAPAQCARSPRVTMAERVAPTGLLR